MPRQLSGLYRHRGREHLPEGVHLHADGVIYPEEDCLHALRSAALSSSAAGSGRSSTSRISGRKICAPRTERSCTSAPTTASLPRAAGDLLITRGLCVSFHRRWVCPARATWWSSAAASTGIPLKGREGLWQPYPVEYKRGRAERGQQRCPAALRAGDVSGGNALLRNPAGRAVLRRDPHRRTEVSLYSRSCARR